MSKKKSSISCLLAMMLPVAIYAQQVSSAVTGKFSNAVIIRLHEVASRMPLTPEKQMTLATVFHQEDSLMAEAIKKGLSEKEINEIRLAAQQHFQKQFTEQELLVYYSKKGSGQARSEAAQMMAIVQKKYKCDSVMAKSVYDAFYAWRVNIERIHQQYAGAAAKNDQLLQAVARYSTLTEKPVFLAGSNDFILRKLDTLNAIKPLPGKVQAALKSAFMNHCYRNPEQGYAGNFSRALHEHITDTAYYAALFHNEIDRQTAVYARRGISNLLRQRSLNREEVNKVMSLFYAKEKALATYQYAMPEFNEQKDIAIIRTTRYYDSAIQAVTAMNNPELPASRFAEAVKLRKELKLTNAQVDTLSAYAITLGQMRTAFMATHPDSKFSAVDFESRNMERILAEEQYNRLLMIKHAPKAMEWAKQDWAEMRQKGITQGFDSATVINQIYNYDLARLVAKSRYENDPVKKNAVLRMIMSNPPAAVRKLKAAANGNPLVNKEMQGNFKW